MKKNIYLLLTTFLGILLGGVVIAFVEKWIINNALSQGALPQAYFYIREDGYISPYLSAGILIAGAVFGFLLGRKWWRIVYIEKRHWRKKGWKR